MKFMKLRELKKIIAKKENENDELKYLVPFEDIFQAILMCHNNVGHYYDTLN